MKYRNNNMQEIKKRKINRMLYGYPKVILGIYAHASFIILQD